jgi:hypothetical protein
VELYSALNGLASRTSNLEVQARTVLAQPDTTAPPDSMSTGVNTGDQLLTVTPIRKVTSNTTITLQDEMILAEAVAAPLTVTLPPIATVPKGQFFTVKRLDNSGNLLQITGDANIDGSSARSLPFQYMSITVQTDGIQWWIR